MVEIFAPQLQGYLQLLHSKIDILAMNLRMHKMKIEHFLDLKGMVDRMKLIKLPFKVIAFPLVALLWLVGLLAKATVKIACYVVGPVMLFLFGLIIYVVSKQQWNHLILLGGMEAFCLLLLFGVTWMIANVEDVNGMLIEFIKS
jgi:hypothetical protein